MYNWQKLLIGIGIVVMITLLFRVSAVNFVEPTEMGYKYNKITGQIDSLERSGYFITWPIVEKIHTIELRPFQVCISSNGRVMNCKLLKFNPKGFRKFINLHGRNSYSIPSMTSNPNGSEFSDIMKGYAYESYGKLDSSQSKYSLIEDKYPFLTILQEVSAVDECQDCLK